MRNQHLLFFLLIFFTIFSVNSSCSQKKSFTVRDSLTNEKIDFVSINLLNGKGFYSDLNGEVIFDFEEIEEIELSHLSYNSRKVKIRNIISDVVFLSKKTYLLNEIILNQNKNKKIYIEKDLNKYFNDSISCDFGSYGMQIALLIKLDNKKEYFLDKISFPIKIDKVWQRVNNLKEFPNALVRISFFKNINNIPSDILINEFDYININKKNIKDNFFSYFLKNPISIPEEGVFCIITFIGETNEDGELIIEDPFYQSTFKGKNIQMTKYSPIQIPLEYSICEDDILLSRNYFFKNSTFKKATPRISVSVFLSEDEKKIFLENSLNNMRNYTINIGFKYFYYE